MRGTILDNKETHIQPKREVPSFALANEQCNFLFSYYASYWDSLYAPYSLQQAEGKRLSVDKRAKREEKKL